MLTPKERKNRASRIDKLQKSIANAESLLQTMAKGTIAHQRMEEMLESNKQELKKLTDHPNKVD